MKNTSIHPHTSASLSLCLCFLKIGRPVTARRATLDDFGAKRRRSFRAQNSNFGAHFVASARAARGPAGPRTKYIYKYLRDGGIFPETFPLLPRPFGQADIKKIGAKIRSHRVSRFGTRISSLARFPSKNPSRFRKKAKS